MKRVPTNHWFWQHHHQHFSTQVHCHLISFCPTPPLYFFCYPNCTFVHMLSHTVASSSRQTVSSSGHYDSSTMKYPQYQEQYVHQHKQQFYYPESVVHHQCFRLSTIVSHQLYVSPNPRARGSKHQPISRVNLTIHTLDRASVDTAIAANTAIRYQTDWWVGAVPVVDTTTESIWNGTKIVSNRQLKPLVSFTTNSEWAANNPCTTSSLDCELF